MNKIGHVILTTVFIILFLPVLVIAGTVQLPQTGQTTYYDTADKVISCAGTGQDGDIKAGVAWPSPRFAIGTDMEGDCVTDNLTGLMWTKHANLSGVHKPWKDIPGVYITWYQAMDYAKNLILCGYSDWRLPNRKELFSLIDHSKAGPAIPENHPFIGVGTLYWSSTSDAGGRCRYVVWRLYVRRF